MTELVRRHEAAGKRETAIEIGESRGDVRVHPVPHDASALVLVEAEQQRQSQERPRLRAAFGDRVRDGARDRIRRARRVGFLVSEERIRDLSSPPARCRARADPSRCTRSSYRRAGSNPFFTQIVSGSGVPGNGVVEQSANAHSVLGIVTAPFFAPVAISPVAEMSVAFVVSSDTGGYGEGWPRGITSCVVCPGQIHESQHQRTGNARPVAILRDRHLNRVIRRWSERRRPASR